MAQSAEMAKSFDIGEYLALPRPTETFLIDGILPFGGALLLYGDPKVGKSFAALQLSQSIVNGEDWLGFSTNRGKVLYVQLDTPRGLWMHRMAELIESGEPLLNENLHIADRESLETWPFNILYKPHYDVLREEVDRIEPDVVIIDVLKEAHQLPENDNSDSQKVLAALTAATQPAALVLIHHAKKAQWDQPTDVVSGARGATYLTGRMDGIIHMTPKTLKYVSRATEGGSIALDRKDNGYWELPIDSDQMKEWVRYAKENGTSMREMARILSELSGMSVEAARSRLRRE